MATSSGPNLNAAVIQIERLMDDTCQITRNPAADIDATLNYTTGLITPTAATIIYDDATLGANGRPLLGRCKITSLRDSQPTTQPGVGYADDLRYYRFGIPIDSPPLHLGDVVVITSARRWQTMVGHIYDVRETIDSTFAVQQKVVCERRIQTLAGEAHGITTAPPLINQTGAVTAIAGQVIPAGRVIRLDLTLQAWIFEPSDLSQQGEIYGITLNSVNAGETVVIMPLGIATIHGWGLPPDTEMWAGPGGSLTPTPPTAFPGLSVLVGKSITSETFLVRIGQTIRL